MPCNHQQCMGIWFAHGCLYTEENGDVYKSLSLVVLQYPAVSLESGDCTLVGCLTVEINIKCNLYSINSADR